MVYLDDIEEFQSPMSKDGKGQDQRLFMFKSIVIPTREKNEVGCFGESEIKEYESWNEKAGPRMSRKSRKVGGQRLRKSLVSLKISRVKGVECSIYYNRKSNHWKVYREKMQMDDSKKSYPARENLELPGFVKIGSEFVSGKFICKGESVTVNDSKRFRKKDCCASDWKKDSGSSPWHQKRRITTFKEEKFEHRIYSAASLCPCSLGSNSWARKETHHPYLRAMTMPSERPEDCCADNIARSNSFPFNNGSSSSPHVHPKLPDYDELAAKFMALKKANLQNKQQ